MFKQMNGSGSAKSSGINKTSTSDSQISKYVAAEILTSMTSNVPLTQTSLTAGVYSVTNTITGTTPTLTPNTVKKIDQILINHEKATGEDLVASASNTNIPIMVQPIKNEIDYYDDSSNISSEQDYGISGKRRRNEDGSYSVPQIDPQTFLVANSRRPTGPRRSQKDDDLSTEEQEKRRMRRERNKKAAAKCRQRREDHTSRLINETEGLEDEKSKLELEIQTLYQQKEQLEFLLQSHKPNCLVTGKTTQQHGHTGAQQKGPPGLQQHGHTGAQPQSAHQTHSVVQTFKFVQSANSKNAVTTANKVTARPNSLPLSSQVLASVKASTSIPKVSEMAGLTMTTPSSGIGVFHFDHAIVEGHTGLTPLNQTPLTATSSIGLSGHITTPGNGTNSCSEQVKRRSTDSSSSNEMSSPTLVRL